MLYGRQCCRCPDLSHRVWVSSCSGHDAFAGTLVFCLVLFDVHKVLMSRTHGGRLGVHAPSSTPYGGGLRIVPNGCRFPFQRTALLLHDVRCLYGTLTGLAAVRCDWPVPVRATGQAMPAGWQSTWAPLSLGSHRTPHKGGVRLALASPRWCVDGG